MQFIVNNVTTLDENNYISNNLYIQSMYVAKYASMPTQVLNNLQNVGLYKWGLLRV